jgi:predicted AAA+ superfamily ATPase
LTWLIAQAALGPAWIRHSWRPSERITRGWIGQGISRLCSPLFCAVFGGFKPSPERADRGALWENAVFNELEKRLYLLDEIQFWRSKNGTEVDFVVRRGERMVAIEVKAAELTRPMVSRGTHSFLEAYRPACLGVVNASLRLDTVEDGVTVRFVRPWELDLVLGALD